VFETQNAAITEAEKRGWLPNLKDEYGLILRTSGTIITIVCECVDTFTNYVDLPLPG